MKTLLDYINENIIDIFENINERYILQTIDDAISYFRENDLFNYISEDELRKLYKLEESKIKSPIIANYKNTKGYFALRRWVLNYRNILPNIKFNQNTDKNYRGLHDGKFGSNQNITEVDAQDFESIICFAYNIRSTNTFISNIYNEDKPETKMDLMKYCGINNISKIKSALNLYDKINQTGGFDNLISDFDKLFKMDKIIKKIPYQKSEFNNKTVAPKTDIAVFESDNDNSVVNNFKFSLKKNGKAQICSCTPEEWINILEVTKNNYKPNNINKSDIDTYIDFFKKNCKDVNIKQSRYKTANELKKAKDEDLNDIELQLKNEYLSLHTSENHKTVKEMVNNLLNDDRYNKSIIWEALTGDVKFNKKIGSATKILIWDDIQQKYFIKGIKSYINDIIMPNIKNISIDIGGKNGGSILYYSIRISITSNI